MSLELATHLQLGNFDRLKRIESWYEKVGHGYSTAWNTVKTGEAYLEFIRELQDPAQWQVNAKSIANSKKNLALQ